MKNLFIILLMFIGTSAYNQVNDTNANTTVIPAEETEDSNDNSLDIKPLNKNEDKKTTLNGLTLPESRELNTNTSKEFSMFGEEFGNPGELYKKRFDKTEESLEPKTDSRLTGETTNQYLGDYKTTASKVNIVYRDFGQEDGDLFRVFVNDDVRITSTMLQYNYKGFKLDLNQGFNKIDFQALNVGSIAPNTAEVKIVDEQGNIIASSSWNLAAGVKATLILIKE